MYKFTFLPLNTTCDHILAHLQEVITILNSLAPWAILNGCFPKINFLIAALPGMTPCKESTTRDNGFSPGLFSRVETETCFSCARLYVVALDCLGGRT